MPEPSKADIERLQKLVNEWNRDERNMRSHYGPAEPGSMRYSRMKDAEALAALLVHVTAESSPKTGVRKELPHDQRHPCEERDMGGNECPAGQCCRPGMCKRHEAESCRS